jgi:hypothetical protein
MEFIITTYKIINKSEHAIYGKRSNYNQSSLVT